MATAASNAMIQIRHVPANVHRTLKARAALAGMSLSDYLLRELKRVAESPTFEETLARIRSLPPVKSKLSAAEVVRQIRGE